MLKLSVVGGRGGGISTAAPATMSSGWFKITWQGSTLQLKYGKVQMLLKHAAGFIVR